MRRELLPTTESNLKEVQNKFHRWRKSRKERRAIPEELWEAAVGLSKYYSIHQISRALRLNHTALRKRVEDSNKKADTTPAFVELQIRDRSPSSAHCMVEMEKQDGATMKMYFHGEADLDLLELGKAFWSNGK